MKITVYGSGCANCKRLFDNTKTAATNLGIKDEVEYVTDLKVIASTGIMKTPALVIDNRLVASGRVLTVEEVTPLLKAK